MKKPSSWIFLSLAVSLLLFSCNEKDCEKMATVVELSDGCGYGFELANGKQLQPVWDMLYCGTPPLPPEVTEDPLYNFHFVAGKKVLIGYESRRDHDACGNSQPVNITCLQEVDSFE
jgi:hypothetical protein